MLDNYLKQNKLSIREKLWTTFLHPNYLHTKNFNRESTLSIITVHVDFLDRIKILITGHFVVECATAIIGAKIETDSSFYVIPPPKPPQEIDPGMFITNGKQPRPF
jgi:hypothetical protein